MIKMPSFVLEVAICKQSINQILFYQKKKKSNIRTELAIVSKKKKRTELAIWEPNPTLPQLGQIKAKFYSP